MKNVYVWLWSALTDPSQRTEKLSTGTPLAGLPLPQLKFTVASVRVVTSVLKAVPL